MHIYHKHDVKTSELLFNYLGFFLCLCSNILTSFDDTDRIKAHMAAYLAVTVGVYIFNLPLILSGCQGVVSMTPTFANSMVIHVSLGYTHAKAEFGQWTLST